jgi:hypothetical protein
MNGLNSILKFSLISWGSLYFCPQFVSAHVRQRVFIHDSKTAKTGTESLVKWADSTTIKISMQNYSGGIGSGTTSVPSLTATAAQTLFGSALSQWIGTHRNMVLPLSLDLDTGNLPYLISSGCESPAGDEGNIDGINNLLFESKIDTSCSEAIAVNGVIGVTKVRYSIATGEIVEADLQLDDNTFLFKTSGSNNLTSTPKEINLNDVVVHELGHFFGLDHTSVRQSTMLFAVADNMQTAKDDDLMGLYSLYPPTNLQDEMGSLSGSVLDANNQPVFGAVVFALDSRTLTPVASEMTNVNGAFEFCALPPGSYVVYVNRYQPFGLNIHSYYSGFGVSGETTYFSGGQEKCFNPGCTLMTELLALSFWSRDLSVSGATGGLGLNVVQVNAGQNSSYLNLSGSNSVPEVSDVPTGSTSSSASVIEFDDPRLARLSQTTMDLEDSSTPTLVGTDQYFFTLAATEKIRIATTALRMYSRLRLKLELFTANSIGGTDLAGTAACTNNSGNLSQGVISTADDPKLICDLSAGDYVVRVTGNPVDCDLVPGNSQSCANAQVGESASSSIPFYLINLSLESDVGSTSTHPRAEALDSLSLASTVISNLPSCGASSLETSNSLNEDAEPEGACCGTIRDSQFSGPKSFLLSVLLNPVTLFGLGWMMRLYGLRRRKLVKKVFTV